MCEVLLAEGSAHVSVPHIFWSHMQAKQVPYTVMRMRRAAKLHKVAKRHRFDPPLFYWLDYASLRQCKPNDFVVERIRDVIKEVGLTLAESVLSYDYSKRCYNKPATTGFPFMERSFCIFEILASIQTNTKVQVTTDSLAHPDNYCEFLMQHPLSSKQATTHNPEEKRMIDDFIYEKMGYEQVDNIVMNLTVQGAFRNIYWNNSDYRIN